MVRKQAASTLMRQVLTSFAYALQNIRTRFFHTVLSILGIVIGVGALVAILSLIDGMEEYAREQITKTTTLNAILLQSNPYKTVNDIPVRKTEFDYVTPTAFAQLGVALTKPATTYLMWRQNSELTTRPDNRPLGASVAGRSFPLPPGPKLLHGRLFTAQEVTDSKPVALINQKLAKQLVGKQPERSAVGRELVYASQPLIVVGILADDDRKMAEVTLPITLIPADVFKVDPPRAVIDAQSVEDVPALKADIEAWLSAHMPHKTADFSVITNESRVDQVMKGFLLFRLVMGLIVGISVLVGGIGVMNVLLISVTERTVEIGVRKALGAKKRDILWQFLSESITISTFGSLLGLLLGIGGTLAFGPIVKALTDVPFQAAYTWQTFGLIVFIAMLIGIVFGTYPALRAARLDPVEAIRRE